MHESRTPRPAVAGALEALALSLCRRADAVAELLAASAAERALCRAEWYARAGERAAHLDAVVATTCVRLDDDAPERACVDAWLREVCDDTGGPDLRRILEPCATPAEALVRERLDTAAPALRLMRTHLERLCAALDENPAAWRLPLARLPALATLAPTLWPALGRAPAWAVVRALAEPTACTAAYHRDLATLAHRPGVWATPRAGAAARFATIEVATLAPARIGALLAQWPWPQADPPLATVAAWASTARTRITRNTWGAALACDPPVESLPLWLGAEQWARSVECGARRLHARIEEAIERTAHAHLARWLLERAGCTPADALLTAAARHAEGALECLRALWASEPRLAPPRAARHPMRLELAPPVNPRRTVPVRVHHRVRGGRALVWRVPYTSPERLIVGNRGVEGLAGELARHLGFALYARDPDTPAVMQPPLPGPPPPRSRERAAALGDILKRVGAEWRL